MAMQGYGIYDQNLPPEIAAEQGRIQQRRKIAEALMQSARQPIQSANPNSAISWTQGAAQILEAYKGRKNMDEADQATSELGGKYQRGLAEEVARIAAMRQGAPATTDAADNIEQPGTPADPRQAVQAALMSQYGPVREMGKLDFQADLKSKEAALARAARLEERAMQLDAQATERDLDRASRERIAKEANDVKRELAEIRSALGGGGNPYFTPVYTPNGVVSFNNRTGGGAPLMVNGQPVIRSSDSPQLQGDLAGARAAGKAQATREFNMSGIGSTIKRAEDVLKGVDPDTGAARPKPTGSGVGSLVDKVAGFFGASPTGAREATDLKAISGALTSKMPRMEGPQSDRDTQLYREMAAQVGDESIPVDQRLRALETVKALWRKYEKHNPDAFQGDPATANEAPPAGISPEEWAVMPPEDRALFKQ
jgi:hypothetical protein